ncbi:MAG TPA: DUF6599 family protein [Acidobacteriaceae bacterium]|nr:DUF6599 family protein [Acidobacteriaceae bacterium]
MALGFGTRRCVALAVMSAGLAVGARGGLAQGSVSLMEPQAPLLPAKFGEWTRVDAAGGAQPGATAGAGAGSAAGAASGAALLGVNPHVLGECGLIRSKAADYTRGGRTVHIEAVQFGDRTGAYSAFTLAERPGMRVGGDLVTYDAVGGNAVLFMRGKSVVLAEFEGAATAQDVAGLRPLVEVMPKAFGNTGAVPILPTLTPAKGLVGGSLRYALGQMSYAAGGGVIPAASLNWKMEPEAVTAQYDDARGQETLTMLMFPTPTLAQEAAKTIQGEVPALKSGGARLRQDGTLVLLATGNFSGDAAQQMIAGIHLSQMTFNQDAHPAFKVVAAQTFSLLENIAILSGVLGTGAVLLGLFLGFGRAWFRVLRGKPAAVEAEFLSLHLAPQNKPAVFGGPDSAAGA